MKKKNNMKYIRLYEAFENIKSIRIDVGDILQELTDKYILHETFFGFSPCNYISIALFKSYHVYDYGENREFKWSDISDEIYHLIQYMESIGGSISSIEFRNLTHDAQSKVYPKCISMPEWQKYLSDMKKVGVKLGQMEDYRKRYFFTFETIESYFEKMESLSKLILCFDYIEK